MTKGQLEAKISEIVSRYEVLNAGRGPKTIRSYIIGDMIVIRMITYLSQGEKKLATSKKGVELYKQVNILLFEEGKGTLETMLTESFNLTIKSAHMDISTKTGEKVIVLSLLEDIESKIRNNESISVYS